MKEFKTLTNDELEEVIGGINIKCFSACLQAHGASALAELKELVAAINNKNWERVESLSQQAPIASLPIVKECKSSC